VDGEGGKFSVIRVERKITQTFKTGALLFLLQAFCGAAEDQTDAAEVSLGSDSAAGIERRVLAGDGCSVKANIGSVKKIGGGVFGGRLTLHNTGSESVHDVLVILGCEKMSYVGTSHDRLSVFPTGEADFYFSGPKDGVLLGAGEIKTFPIFWKDGANQSVKQVICSGEGILEGIYRRIELDQRFGKYTPFAKSSIRDLHESKLGWADILDTSEAQDVDGVGRAYFFASISDNCLNVIAQGIAMMGIGDQGVTDYQQGFMIDSYFKDAQKEFENGKFEEALGFLQKVLALHPDNAMALNNTAYIMLKKGDKASAARPFIEQAVKTMPDEPSFQNTMSLVLWEEGEKEEAIAMATKAHIGSGGQIPDARSNLIKWTGSVPSLPGQNSTDGNGGEGNSAEDANPDGVENVTDAVTTSNHLPAR